MAAHSRDGLAKFDGRASAQPPLHFGPARVLAAEARLADLTLLSQSTGMSTHLDMLEGPLFEAGSPVLLTGGDMTHLDQVMIAWDGSPAAVRRRSRAVHH